MCNFVLIYCIGFIVSIQAEGGCEEDGGEALFGAHRRACGVPACRVAIQTITGWRLVCVFEAVPVYYMSAV